MARIACTVDRSPARAILAFALFDQPAPSDGNGEVEEQRKGGRHKEQERSKLFKLGGFNNKNSPADSGSERAMQTAAVAVTSVACERNCADVRSLPTVRHVGQISNVKHAYMLVSDSLPCARQRWRKGVRWGKSSGCETYD